MAKNPFIAVRVPPEIIKSLDEIAAERGISRSALVKELLANCHSFHRFIQVERARLYNNREVLDGNLSQWVMNNMQDNMKPEWLHFIGEVMHHVADEVADKKPEKPVNELGS
jgi:hypothetical protein